MKDLSKHGNMPAGAEAERILAYGYDTIVFKANSSTDDFTTLVEKDLFSPNENKHPVLKSNNFPLEASRIARIVGLSITHNFKFAKDSHIHSFEQFAQLGCKIEDKDYTDIPVLDLLPYNRVANGGLHSYREIIKNVQQVATDPSSPGTNEWWYNTTTGLLKYKSASAVVVVPQNVADSFNVLALNQKYKQLLAPIDPPNQGKIQFKFKPQMTNLKTDLISVYGEKFGAGIVGDDDPAVMYLRLNWVGEIIRPAK